MAARILEGKFFAQQFKEDAAERVKGLQEKHGVTPGLAVIIVG
ncbi:MAG TPA: bifunctional 5,10-methylene-tetrahydrofolate dehydrogenase/5,10-methylene-tetrahydrofolate cyclohydrolase, partial [Selenomonas sp.]|nr:bifunctional 5,10-methylene-tetrahydrofolate dehydrogenase/5,10-methylene-tetrahydrofolate cyclohydrolase [Selenomonas sp.]